MIDDFFFVARGRSVFMGLRAYDAARAGELVPLVQKVSSAVPGTFAVAKQSSLFEQGLSAGRTIDIEITGPELTKLVALGGQILGQVKQMIPEAQARPIPSLDLSTPEVHIRPKLLQAAEMGVSSADLGFAANALIDGAYVSDYYLDNKKIDLVVKGEMQFAASTQDVESLPMATPIGQLIPLGSLADVTLSSGPEQVNHRERIRAITIEVSPPPEVPLEYALNRIDSEIVQPLQESGQLAGGYRLTLSGTADKLRDTWSALRFNVVLALLITYLLMAALFESWLYPLVIIFSVPLGAVGGILGLQLLNLFIFQPLDVLTMLGFVILIGTVVNNPILIVHQSLSSYARRPDVAATGDSGKRADAHSADLHDHDYHRLGPIAAGAVSRRRQRTLSRVGQRRAGRTARLDRLHAVSGADVVQPDDGCQGATRTPALGRRAQRSAATCGKPAGTGAGALELV